VHDGCGVHALLRLLHVRGARFQRRTSSFVSGCLRGVGVRGRGREHGDRPVRRGALRRRREVRSGRSSLLLDAARVPSGPGALRRQRLLGRLRTSDRVRQRGVVQRVRCVAHDLRDRGLFGRRREPEPSLRRHSQRLRRHADVRMHGVERVHLAYERVCGSVRRAWAGLRVRRLRLTLTRARARASRFRPSRRTPLRPDPRPR
jgi:hypothetical protein